jgi:hypothetical protein
MKKKIGENIVEYDFTALVDKYEYPISEEMPCLEIRNLNRKETWIMFYHKEQILELYSFLGDIIKEHGLQKIELTKEEEKEMEETIEILKGNQT